MKNDKKLRDILKESKMNAPEKLSNRIMHQINYDQMLKPKVHSPKFKLGIWFKILTIVFLSTPIVLMFVKETIYVGDNSILQYLVFLFSIVIFFIFISVYDELVRKK